MSEIIRLENVVKMTDNGHRALSGVSMQIDQGERVIIHGAPGSGKTALMRIIAGMDKPSDGKVFVLEQPLHEMSEAKAAALRNETFGILQRNPAFVETLTLGENVGLPLSIRGVSAEKRQKAVRDMLKSFGLLYAIHALPGKLSAMEIKLADVARALIGKPQILLLSDTGADLSQRDREQLKGTLHALSEFGTYTILEFTGAQNGLIDASRTWTLEFGRIQEEVQ